MLTLEEQATNYQTLKHIRCVQRLLNRCAAELIARGETHDESKMHEPELAAMVAQTATLAGTTYASPEYVVGKQTPLMAPALAHHYANNAHHPEHYKNGVEDMTLLDILEMLCDWKASSTRHNDGNIRKSIETNANRFRLSPQLVRIMENTVALFEGEQER